VIFLTASKILVVM